MNKPGRQYRGCGELYHGCRGLGATLGRQADEYSQPVVFWSMAPSGLILHVLSPPSQLFSITGE